MASFPKDQFDRLPADLERVGAHRGPAARGRGWIGFAWAALATVVLVLGGLFALNRVLGVDFGLPFFAAPTTAAPTPAPTPTAEPVTDPTTIDPARAIKIAILNGTPVSGLQGTIGASLSGAGWPVTSTLPSSDRDIETTYVYYSNPADEDIARGLVLALGFGDIRLVDPTVFPATTITIVLGLDTPGAAPVEPAPETTP